MTDAVINVQNLLEQRLQDRTADLAKANELLGREIGKRKQADRALLEEIAQRKKSDEALSKELGEIEALKDRVRVESEFLKRPIKVTQPHGMGICESGAM